MSFGTKPSAASPEVNVWATLGLSLCSPQSLLLPPAVLPSSLAPPRGCRKTRSQRKLTSFSNAGWQLRLLQKNTGTQFTR